MTHKEGSSSELPFLFCWSLERPPLVVSGTFTPAEKHSVPHTGWASVALFQLLPMFWGLRRSLVWVPALKGARVRWGSVENAFYALGVFDW